MISRDMNPEYLNSIFRLYCNNFKQIAKHNKRI